MKMKKKKTEVASFSEMSEISFNITSFYSKVYLFLNITLIKKKILHISYYSQQSQRIYTSKAKSMPKHHAMEMYRESGGKLPCIFMCCNPAKHPLKIYLSTRLSEYQ
jgi:hypothetical protein